MFGSYLRKSNQTHLITHQFIYNKIHYYDIVPYCRRTFLQKKKKNMRHKYYTKKKHCIQNSYTSLLLSTHFW